MLPRAASYDELTAKFRWQVPERYNIAVDACDKWAGTDRLALIHLAGDGGEGSRDDYLAFGMTDALISELSRFGGLRVISQTSAMRYKGSPKPLPEIARELGVEASEGLAHRGGTHPE